jgi:hypothetical protein
MLVTIIIHHIIMVVRYNQDAKTWLLNWKKYAELPHSVGGLTEDLRGIL